MNHAALFDPEAKIQVLLTRPQLSAETTLFLNVRLLYLLTYLKKKKVVPLLVSDLSRRHVPIN